MLEFYEKKYLLWRRGIVCGLCGQETTIVSNVHGSLFPVRTMCCKEIVEGLYFGPGGDYAIIKAIRQVTKRENL